MREQPISTTDRQPDPPPPAAGETPPLRLVGAATAAADQPAAAGSARLAVQQQFASARNLARWLMGNDPDADDVTQEACLRALRSPSGPISADARAWLLTIVRRVAYERLGSRGRRPASLVDEGLRDEAPLPPADAVRRADTERIRAALAALDEPWREVLVLRELEGPSYRHIACVLGLPIGTVMSRLSRARALLARLLVPELSDAL